MAVKTSILAPKEPNATRISLDDILSERLVK
jgi:hypothetical protein